MNKVFEGVEPKNRDYFKNGLKNISTMFHVSFEGMSAKIEYDEPYIKSIEMIETKAKHIKAMNQFFGLFKEYQFNH